MLSTVIRALHLGSAVALGVLIYSGWSEDSTAELVAKLGAFPLLFVTGVYLFAARQKAQHRP